MEETQAFVFLAPSQPLALGSIDRLHREKKGDESCLEGADIAGGWGGGGTKKKRRRGMCGM